MVFPPFVNLRCAGLVLDAGRKTDGWTDRPADEHWVQICRSDGDSQDVRRIWSAHVRTGDDGRNNPGPITPGSARVAKCVGGSVSASSVERFHGSPASTSHRCADLDLHQEPRRGDVERGEVHEVAWQGIAQGPVYLDIERLVDPA